jgi:hypothetical protein
MSQRALRVLLVLSAFRPMAFAAWNQVRATASPVTIAALVATLANHVVRVLLVGSKEQMVRPDAERCIAPMADQQVWIVDGTVGQFVSRTMGVGCRALVPELGVSVGTNGASPQPTAVRFRDVLPQALGWIGERGRVGAWARTVGADLCNGVRELDAALRARLCDGFRPNPDAGLVIAVGAAKRRHFAGASQFHLAADRANAFDLRRVVLPMSSVAFLEWHH